MIGSSVAVGMIVGLAAGASGGWVDESAMRTTDIFPAFPPLSLAILLVAALVGFTSTAPALALAWWPFYAVLVRGQAASVRGQPYIERRGRRGVPPSAASPRRPTAAQRARAAAGAGDHPRGRRDPGGVWGELHRAGAATAHRRLGTDDCQRAAVRAEREFGGWRVSRAGDLATALAFAVLGDALRVRRCHNRPRIGGRQADWRGFSLRG